MPVVDILIENLLAMRMLRTMHAFASDTVLY